MNLTEYVPIKNLGGRKHPHYDERQTLWNFLLASWRGGLGMSYRAGMKLSDVESLKLHGYYAGLFKFKREAAEDYINRVAMSPYTPLARQIVEEYCRYVTKDDPARKGAEKYKELIEDTDNAGRGMSLFVRDTLAMAMVMGEIGILVDMPETVEPVASKADAIEKGLRAYAVTVLPQSIVDWSIGDDGKYEWLIIETAGLVNDPTDEDGTKTVIYRTYWDKYYWQKYQSVQKVGDVNANTKASDWKLTASGEHPCGEVPVIRLVINDVDRNALTPESWFFDLADLNRAIYNLDSLDLANLYYQTFGILVLPPADSDAVTTILSRTHALTEHPDTNGITRFVQTTGAAGESFDRKIKELKERMYMVAGLQYQTNKNVPESGISKAWDFQRVNQFLTGIARFAEQIEKRVSSLAGKWEGNSEGYSAEYPKDYSVQELADLIAGILGIKQVGFGSETGRKESLKRMYREVLPDLSDEMRRKLDAEIDASEEPDPLKGFDISRKEEEEEPV